MPCYYPIDGWRSKACNQNGRFPIVFDRKSAQQDSPIKLPCGRCIGCRLQKSKHWAIRCEHEARQHAENCFITLTYNDEHLPHGASLQKDHWQKFMKRLRRHIEPQKIRFFMAGEYGTDQNPLTTETIGRPHYHSLIFGYDFPDKVPLDRPFGDEPLYTSEILEKLWPFGYSSIGKATFESAAYIARYTTKKISGPMAESHYRRTDTRTGENTDIHPEFGLQSRNPGIGASWFHQYHTDLNKGYFHRDGQKQSIPDYYLKLMEKHQYHSYEQVKEARRIAFDYDDPEYQGDRLRVKEKIVNQRTKTLKRQLSCK